MLRLGSMIRNKDYGIEQVIFSNLLLRHTELLDDYVEQCSCVPRFLD